MFTMNTPSEPIEAVVKSMGECAADATTPCSKSRKPDELNEKCSSGFVQAPTSPQSVNATNISKPLALPNGVSGQASPELSSVSSLSSPSATPTPQRFGFDGSAQSAGRTSAEQAGDQGVQPPPAKRRKLTLAEKEERKQEKEAKDREKAEQKAKKDEERRIKEEEKKLKEEERRKQNEIKEQKKQEKEREKQEKEREKQRMVEEKEKKERAQQKLHTFFTKPKTPPRQSAYTLDQQLNQEQAANASMDDLGKAHTQLNDYRRTFLPFSLPFNTTWAPASHFTWDHESTQHVRRKIDQSFGENCFPCVNLEDSIGLCKELIKPRGIIHETVKNLVLRLGGDQSNPIDLTGSQPDDPMKSLQKIPMRYIQFQEDVRPPYIGTYTKIGQRDLNLTARNPFRKSRLDTNYEYDSEAEWEELEDDDEDLMSEGESELESTDGADEMDDLIDDDDAEGQLTRKKIISSDLEPNCTGLCWENTDGVASHADGTAIRTSRMKIALLQDCLNFPLDPFSSQYWLESQISKAAPKQNLPGSMQPPRQPLQDRPNMFMNASLSADRSTSMDEEPTKPSLPSTLRLLTGSELEEFKQAVQGSEHTKAGLIAILKKQFSKIPKPVLQDTLSMYAKRVGRKEAEKRWMIKEDDKPLSRTE